MTAHNVRQYLEKIYSVPVADVRVKMVHHDLPPVDIPQKERSGRSLDSTDYPPKPERYEKFAYVRLAPGEVFTFPDIFKEKRPTEIIEKLSEDIIPESKEIVVAPNKSEPEKFHRIKGSRKWFTF
ncbi:unnamed protein product [Heterobilharzia americana]|nr:unnamed protein product [Heterobilharzia americana]CAH8611572.1 unnamed protein product [Heterobilharzia americana]